MIRGLALSLVAAMAAGASSKSPRTGSTRIDHFSIHWIDSTRPEPWTPDATDHRKLLVHAYYRRGLHEPAPLVLFSTGRNVAPKSYVDLVEAVAKRGYVVAIVEHLGERSGQKLPSGAAVPNLLPRVAPDRDSASFEKEDAVFMRGWVELRAEDLTSVRTHLQALAAARGNRLSGRLNAHAAAVGHSLGGLTAAKACERDAGFSACANLDGLSYSLPMHVDGDTMAATQPFLFLGKPIRHQDDEIGARFGRRFDTLMRSAKGGSYKVIVRDADHMNFAGGGNGKVAKTVREYVMAFLDKHLRGARGTLLDTATSDPAVTVARYPPHR